MIFRGPEEPLVFPDVSLTRLLLEQSADRGDKPAFIDAPSGRALTYREWGEVVRKAAAGLARRGLRKGDVFAIYSPNLPEYAVALHAVSLAGGVTTTISPLYTAAELGHQLTDAGAQYIVTVPSFLAKAQEAARECGLREVFVFGEAEGATPFASLLEGGTDLPTVPIDPRRDVVVLPYSSGTTGLPKGVMLTHYNLVANLLQAERALGMREDDVVLGVLPFFHIYGMLVIMNLGLYAGATVVTMPRFDLEQCLEAMQNYGVTLAPVVPPIILALAKSPIVEKYNLGALRTLLSGAAPLSADIAQMAGARLGCQLMQGYGMTETSPVTHSTRRATAGRTVDGIGPPLPNTEAKVVDVATGAELGPHQEGEICVRGPQVMKGYHQRPDATAALIDSDGWLHTGDVGYADDSACFFVVDRVKELIKYKGLQIAPAELEAVLLGHPAVADAAVIPIPDPEAGQVPKAFVVLRGAATPEDIMRYVAERVAPYKKIRFLEITDQIPKSASGKILRRVLVDRERAGQASRAGGAAPIS